MSSDWLLSNLLPSAANKAVMSGPRRQPGRHASEKKCGGYLPFERKDDQFGSLLVVRSVQTLKTHQPCSTSCRVAVTVVILHCHVQRRVLITNVQSHVPTKRNIKSITSSKTYKYPPLLTLLVPMALLLLLIVDCEDHRVLLWHLPFKDQCGLVQKAPKSHTWQVMHTDQCCDLCEISYVN